MRKSAKRVFITGMGVLTPIGLDLESFRRGLLAGQDGIAPVTQFEVQRHRCQLAGELKNFAPEDVLDPREVPHLSRASQMVRVAAAEALAASAVDLATEERTRIGVVLGTDLGGAPASVAEYRALHRPYRHGRSRGAEVWRSHLLDTPIGTVADQIAARYGLMGRSLIM